MSVVSLLGVKVLNNPAKFTDSYEFEITFECLEQLQKDLEWKLTYVGSATSSEHDQELDSLLVGPIPVGVNKFIFEADPPDPKKIISNEIIGVTVILLTCAYDDREFVRVGYYVNNEYDSEELNNEPPSKPIIERVRRNILAEKPRVTRFAIKWDSEESAPAEYPPDQPEADTLEDDERNYGAEEAELQSALEKEYAEVEKALAVEQHQQPGAAATVGPSTTNGEDLEMAGTDEPKDQSTTAAAATTGTAEDDDSDAESEDLEADSSGSEDEEDEEAEGEGEEQGEGDEDVEMGDGDGAQNQQPQQQQKSGVNGTASSNSEVMVH